MKSLRLNILGWAIALLVTITGLMAPPAYNATLMTVSTIAQTAPQDINQEPSAQSTDTQTQDTQKNETEESDRQSSDSTVKPAQSNTESPSAGPYDMDSIQEFNRALYGS